LWRVTGGDALVVTDVGQHQMWEAQYYHHDRPRSLITSGGLGTMGFALPAAIGAKIARPELEVWAVIGDGGFQMTLAELATIAQEQLEINIAIINNGYLGMVRQWQEFWGQPLGRARVPAGLRQAGGGLRHASAGSPTKRKSGSIDAALRHPGPSSSTRSKRRRTRSDGAAGDRPDDIGSPTPRGRASTRQGRGGNIGGRR
jgi:hypothetical protein